jgi:hypothetical protein
MTDSGSEASAGERSGSRTPLTDSGSGASAGERSGSRIPLTGALPAGLGEDDLVAAVRSALEPEIEHGAPVGLAVSGGGDSVALAHLAVGAPPPPAGGGVPPPPAGFSAVQLRRPTTIWSPDRSSAAVNLASGSDPSSISSSPRTIMIRPGCPASVIPPARASASRSVTVGSNMYTSGRRTSPWTPIRRRTVISIAGFRRYSEYPSTSVRCSVATVISATWMEPSRGSTRIPLSETANWPPSSGSRKIRSVT